MRDLKNQLYEQVARLGKALASPKRLELIELLCQGEKTVEALAADAGISLKLASAHLRELRQAQMVQARRDGKYMLYRLAGPGVAALWVALRGEAEEHLVELQLAMASLAGHEDELERLDRSTILRKARAGEVLVLDVRPRSEYDAGHLPQARSVPVGELKKRLAELPRDMPVVAYCRGPFCMMARTAVDLLRQRGFRAFHLRDGVAEWRAGGMPLEL